MLVISVISGLIRSAMDDEDMRGDSGKLHFPESEYLLPHKVQKTDKFSVMSVNVQSMNNKFQEIRDITHRIMPPSYVYRRFGDVTQLKIIQLSITISHQ